MVEVCHAVRCCQRRLSGGQRYLIFPENRIKVDVQAGGVKMKWDNNSVEAVEPTRDAMHSR